MHCLAFLWFVPKSPIYVRIKIVEGLGPEFCRVLHGPCRVFWLVLSGVFCFLVEPALCSLPPTPPLPLSKSPTLPCSALRVGAGPGRAAGAHLTRPSPLTLNPNSPMPSPRNERPKAQAFCPCSIPVPTNVARVHTQRETFTSSQRPQNHLIKEQTSNKNRNPNQIQGTVLN